jgi:hypothetical protein
MFRKKGKTISKAPSTQQFFSAKKSTAAASVSDERR